MIPRRDRYRRIETDFDDDDCGAWEFIKATLVVLAIAACFAAVLCMCNPFYR